MDNDSDTTPFLILLIHWKKWSSVFERLKSHPDETKKAARNGWLPLHMACTVKAPIEVLKELLRIHPRAARVKDSCQMLPLHYLFDSDEYDPVAPPEGVAELVIDAYPSAASAQDIGGNYPLHLASKNGAMKPKLLKKLIDAYPEAASVGNSREELPLHLACKQWAKNCDVCEMLGALLEAYPEAVFTKGGLFGNLPLHVLVHWIRIPGPNHGNMKALNLILGANMEAANTADGRGELPLHIVCRCGTTELSHEVFLNTVIKANPAAVSAADRDGRLPLHHACVNWSTDCRKMLSKLMGANPEAIHKVDNEGRTPLDLAYKRRNNSQEFVSLLVSVSPNGVLLQQLEQSRSLNQTLTVWLAAATKRVRELEDESKSVKRSKQSA